MHKRIRYALKKRNISQQALADKCQVTRNAVTQWVSENPATRTNPSVESLKVIARMTGYSVSFLVGEIDENGRSECGLLSDREQEIIGIFRLLNRADKEHMLAYSTYLSLKEEYTSQTDSHNDRVVVND